jgi:hypothetical protein
VHTAGLKVACPAPPHDAKGTLIVAIRERATAVLAAAPRHPCRKPRLPACRGGGGALDDVTVIWVEAADRRFSYDLQRAL